ncbi:gamma-taxilin-like isoform X2 [Equus quagga]|nr:gamma-taxilin-like isoform X2 [Equus quagga]XP_046505285.1 gamma-taxilin-like isoform X2 [Equus quagga]XP_046505286.1 gamma-taxilin-like isoform X2 [Equus quagga]
MEESRICRLEVKADTPANSQSDDILQHHDSNCGSASNNHALKEDESSNTTKNRNLVSPVYCTQEPGEEPPGLEPGTDPSDGQQESECSRNKENTLGKEVLLLMQALNSLSTPEEKLAALCKKYADLTGPELTSAPIFLYFICGIPATAWLDKLCPGLHPGSELVNPRMPCELMWTCELNSCTTGPSPIDVSLGLDFLELSAKAKINKWDYDKLKYFIPRLEGHATKLEESRNVQKQMKILQKQQAQIVKEKVLLQSEHSRAILARSKLESLCRELQHHNKTLKEENMQQARQEEESRKEATAHFQFTLNEIQAQLEQHDLHSAKLRQENVELGEKLKKLIEQYALREEHIDKLFKHKELQQQLVGAKLQQTAQLIKEADGKHQRERESLLEEATGSRQKYEEMKQQEVQLKHQLSLYMDKFEEFQTTMAKSNDLFTTFRQEMEKMTKKIKKLEKEMIIWRTKWENNNKVLLQMAEEKTVRDKEYKAFQIKLERLEKLCSALQMERNELSEKMEVLKEQVSVKAAGVYLATPGIQPCTALHSQKRLNPSSKQAPGFSLEAQLKAANEIKGSSRDPFHIISSGL